MADQLPPDPNLLRRDMQAMLSFIQGARIVSMARETAVSQVQGWLLGRYWWSMVTSIATVVAILVVVRLFPGLAPHAGFLCGIVLLLFVARIGALVSIGRRIKDEDIDASVRVDAIYALATLGSGINGLAIALMSSNAFGLVMYAFFASGLPAALGITGGIAPQFQLSTGELHTRMLADRQDAKDATERAHACATAAASASRPEADGIGGADAGPDNATDGASDNGADAASNAAAPPVAPARSCADLQRIAKVADETAALSAEAFLAASQAPLQPRGTARDAGQDSILGSLRYGLGLADVSDLFKILIWVFIAGFFESLVPDMLDALAKRGQAEKEKK